VRKVILGLILLSLTCGGITFQQPIMFAVGLDIGGEYAGEVVSAMNTASQTGSLILALVFGQLVNHFGDYNLPFIPMAALCLIGAFLWLKVDPTVGWFRPAKHETNAPWEKLFPNGGIAIRLFVAEVN
jgi:MFS family permease